MHTAPIMADNLARQSEYFSKNGFTEKQATALVLFHQDRVEELLATKKDLEQLRSDTKKDLKTMENSLKKDIAHMETIFKKDLKTMEMRMSVILGSIMATGLIAIAALVSL